MKNFKDIIEEICLEENIKIDYLSKDWIIKLEKNDKCKIIAGYKFDLNYHGLGEVLDDKYALAKILEYFCIPVIKHHIVYGTNNKEDYALGCNNINYLKDLFFKYNEHVVLKINNGTCGNGVYQISDVKSLEKYYLSLSAKHYSLSLSPYMEIENEYRVIVMNNQVELLYKKELPIVLGNGKDSLHKLLCEFNCEYFKDYSGKDKDLILEKNQEFIYNWKFNLSGGAKPSFIIEESLKEEIKKLALHISKTIDLKFGSIDIIRTKNKELFVLEINSGVMMDNFIKEVDNGYEIAKNIYHKAIKELFKD